jgi:hypothetical protein
MLSLSCTLACCLGVTILPALVAQQRTLHRWLDGGETSLAAGFWREFRSLLRPALWPGIGYCAAVVGCTASALLWSAVPGPYRWVGLAVMLPALGVLITTGAAVTEVATRWPHLAPAGWLKVALRVMAVSPVRSGLTLLGLLAWGGVVLAFPLLCLPVLTGWPALVARWGFAEATGRTANDV